MKNKIVLILLLFCNNIYSFAQNPFKKIVSTFTGSLAQKGHNNNYWLFGTGILSIDSLANPISRFGWFSPLGGGSDAPVAFTKGNKIIAVGFEQVSNFNNGILVFKADTDYSIIWKSLYDTMGLFLNSVISCSDNNILVWGTTESNHPLPGYCSLIKIDSMGNPIWRKLYNTSPFFTSQFIELFDRNYLASLSSVSPWAPHFGCGLLKIDTSGNVLWCKSYLRPRCKINCTIEDSVDKSIVMICDTQVNTLPYNHTFYLLKVDSVGNSLWCKSFGNFLAPPYSLRSTKDGGYIISATAHLYDLSDIILIKTDNNGNLEWTSSQGSIYTNENSIDAFQTSDGGYFIIGTTDASYPAHGYYIVKSDSLGISNCQDTTESLIVNNIIVFDSVISVTDTIVPVFTFNSSARDTILSLPSAYDGCLINSVVKSNYEKSNLFAYPNPSSGKIKIQTTEPFTKGNYLTVYDSMGRIIIQKPITKEEDKQFDLTKQGKGIYLIRIKEGDKVSESKVVVE